MLKLDNLHAYYGKSHVLHGVNLELRSGEIVALLGRNGSGRSTAVKTIMGLVEGAGSVSWNGAQILGKKAFEIAHAKIGYVPENRDIFPTLTVHQKLLLGCKGSKPAGRWSFDDRYKLFPRLKERQHNDAGVLSGGEQQMLALCRTLMGDPDLVETPRGPPQSGRVLPGMPENMAFEKPLPCGELDRVPVAGPARTGGECAADAAPRAGRSGRTRPHRAVHRHSLQCAA